MPRSAKLQAPDGVTALAAASDAADRAASGCSALRSPIRRLEDAAGWLVQRASLGIATNVAFLNAHCVNVAYRQRRTIARRVERMDRGFRRRHRRAHRGQRCRLDADATTSTAPICFPCFAGKRRDAGAGIYLFGAQRRDRRGRRPAHGSADARPRRSAARITATSTGADAEQRMIDAINASGAGILLVALGVPAQEFWIARNRHRLSAAGRDRRRRAVRLLLRPHCACAVAAAQGRPGMGLAARDGAAPARAAATSSAMPSSSRGSRGSAASRPAISSRALD